MSQGARPLRAWGAVGLWAVLVWNLGGDGFSAGNTSRLLGPMVAWLFPDLSTAETAQLLFCLRKAAHGVEYAVFAGLTGRALALSTSLRPLFNASFSLTLAGALAGSDELRQGASAMRTGSGGDVALDLAGALLGWLVFSAARARFAARRGRAD